MKYFKGKQFDKDVIILAVGYYFRFSLSYRNVSELLRDRGVSVHHTTIYRWVQQYGNVIYFLWQKKNKNVLKSWRIDETYLKIKGQWRYLYRAVDKDGDTLDFWLRNHRDTKSAYAFIKRLINRFGNPNTLVSDKAPSVLAALKLLQKEGYLNDTNLYQSKYLNNIIKQDHRHIKRKLKYRCSLQSIRTAAITLKGIEVVHALYKKSKKELNLFCFSVFHQLNNLLQYS